MLRRRFNGRHQTPDQDRNKTMKRRDDWPTLLSAFIESRRNRPFVWGQNDCCLFVADWIEQATGVDCAASLRGTYSSGLGAQRILEDHGGIFGTVKHFVEPMGFVSTDYRFTTRGDIVVQDCGNGDAMGIVVGSMAAFVGKEGLQFAKLNTTAAAQFWRI